MSLTIRRTPRTAQGFQEPLLDVSNALPLHMVLIPSGIFVMGSPETELEREQCESPQHEVVVPSFLMGRYPVTQAQYVQVMQTNPAENYDKNRFVAPNKPVVGVTWHEAVEFCDRLADLTGRAYRLPTEAEWEYACRAGTKTPFYFGKTVTTEVANYDGNYVYSDGSQGDYRQATTPVDQFGIANAFGLSDMHGNVWEWCQDSWHDDYNGAPANGSAWLEEEKSSNRVLRGGSWFNNPWPCRSAFRFVFNPEDRSNRFGFRVSCSAPRIL